MPGLINTHGHAAMSLLRGHGDDLALQVWLQEKMWPMEAKMTSEDVYWGTSLSVLEMLKGGTTAFLDMYDHMDQVAKVVEQSGIRAALARGVMVSVPKKSKCANCRNRLRLHVSGTDRLVVELRRSSHRMRRILALRIT